MKQTWSRLCAAVGTGVLLISVAGVAGPALADDIYNNLDGSIDSTAETISLTAGGANGSVTLAVQPLGGDGKAGCNLTGSTTLVVNVASSDPTKATVSPSSLTFDSCGATRVLTVTPVAAGSTTVSLSQVSNNSGGTFTLAPATFTVNVQSATPPNTAPVLTVPSSPVTAEATSAAGAVVNYTATATDAEDNPDPTPLCTPASGSLFPIGSTTVNCAVTDSGGLSDSDSFTVVVSDTLDPTVVVSTEAVKAASGWYNIASSGTAGVAVTVTASDAVGVSDVTCTVNGNPSALDIGNPITVTDGVHDVSCTALDAAGNEGSDSEQFKVDQTNPTMTGTLNPAANTNGWNNTDVSVGYVCADATSGLDAAYGNDGAGCWNDDSVTSDGLTTFHRGISDVAGNVAQFEFSVKRDTVNPTIGGAAAPAPNANGWNNTDVVVTFTCADALSTIDTCVGDDTVTTEGAGQSRTGTATDEAGNTNTATVGDINIDKTAPVIDYTRTAANDAGWNNGPVTVTFSCTDGLSGVDSLTEPITLSATGPDQTATGTCTDAAGNSDTVTVLDINIDLVKPIISGSRSPAANANGWNNGDVTVSFSCTEAGPSGLASSLVAGAIVSTEGVNQSVTNTGVCVDLAGNVADSQTVGGINIDKTAPVISGSASPAPNGAGWNNTNVTVSFTCADTGGTQSGIDTDTVAGDTLTGDGPDQSVTSSGDCVDKAGNAAASATVNNIDIDKTNPTVTVTGVTNGATYTVGSVPVAGCDTTDALSGVKTPATLSSSGGPVGSVTVNCTGALDNADNGGSASATYNVVYAWNGFFQPIDNSPASGPVVFNKAKAGQSIPAKFSLGGNFGLNIIAAGYPKVTQVACVAAAPVDLIENYAAVTANNGLVYDATANQYNYVWKTQSTYAGKCYKFDLALNDGTHHVAYFQFVK